MSNGRTSEALIVRSIMRLLNDLPYTRARKRRGGMGNVGEPDIEACIAGLHFEFEVKRPGQKLTPLQEVKLMQWQKARATAKRVESKVDVMRVICQGIRNFIASRRMNELMEIEEKLSARLKQIERARSSKKSAGP
jgi:hypothetical protein